MPLTTHNPQPPTPDPRPTTPDARPTTPDHRRGSVMIMVVALLVLMALIGTAYIANSRMSRGTSAQQVESHRTEEYADGVKDMVTAALVQDLTSEPAVWTAGRFYRPGQIVSVDAEYNTAPVPPYGTPVVPKQYFECAVAHVSTYMDEPVDGTPAWIPTSTYKKLRPTSSEQLTYSYKHWDSYLTDLYLSPRVPDLQVVANFPSGVTAAPAWRGFS